MCPLCLYNTIVVKRTNNRKNNIAWTKTTLTHSLTHSHTYTNTHIRTYKDIQIKKNRKIKKNQSWKMLVEERKRYLFHFVHLANACLLFIRYRFCTCFFSTFFFSVTFLLYIYTALISTKLKFRSCFASINAWLANFAHKIASSHRSKCFRCRWCVRIILCMWISWQFSLTKQFLELLATFSLSTEKISYKSLLDVVSMCVFFSVTFFGSMTFAYTESSKTVEDIWSEENKRWKTSSFFRQNYSKK